MMSAHKSLHIQAVFFALLNPQADSACFAGMQYPYDAPMDLSTYTALEASVRGQGDNSYFKFYLKDLQSESNSSVAFEYLFKIVDAFAVVNMPLEDFGCSYRGQACDLVLDASNVICLGVQV
jgi:hypothetical protein